MPATEPPALATVLAEMFAASARHGGGVHRRLSSGLHVKVALRGDRRQLIVWRDGGRLPSARECQVVGDDAGLVRPTYRSWQCQDSQDAFLITDAYRGALCTHEWAFPVPYTEKLASGELCRCVTCGAAWRTSTPIRGSKVRTYYNGEEVRPAVLARFQVCGPVPAAHEASGVVAAAPEAAEPASSGATPSRPVVAPPIWKSRARQEEEAQAERHRQREERELPLKRRAVGLLLVCAFGQAVRDPWFRQAFVIENRRTFLGQMSLTDLREELHSRFGRWQLAWGWPVMLLALRWRHQYRALPECATRAAPARRSRTARTSRAVA